MYTSTSVKSKLNEKIYQVKDIREAFAKSNRTFQSKVWNTFEAILNENGEIVPTYVCCKYCHEVKKCTIDSSSGTTNLLRHEGSCRARKTFKSNKKKSK